MSEFLLYDGLMLLHQAKTQCVNSKWATRHSTRVLRLFVLILSDWTHVRLQCFLSLGDLCITHIYICWNIPSLARSLGFSRPGPSHTWHPIILLKHSSCGMCSLCVAWIPTWQHDVGRRGTARFRMLKMKAVVFRVSQTEWRSVFGW